MKLILRILSGALNKGPAHLGQEPVHVDWLHLSEPVHTEDGLDVVRRVPRGVEDNYTVGRHQVDAQRTSFG